jgi:hypothetical protein
LEFCQAKHLALSSRLQLNTYVEKRGSDLLLPFVIRGDKSSSVDLVISGADSTSAGQPFLLKDTVLLNQVFPTDTGGLYVGSYTLPVGLKWKYVRVTASLCHGTDPDSLFDMVTNRVMIVNQK